MKRSALIIFLICLMGCERISPSQTEMLEPTLTKVTNNKSFFVSEDDVLQYCDYAAKRENLGKRDIAKISTYRRDNQVFFYLVNYSNGGYEIISSDKRTYPSVYYSEKGSITVEDIPQALSVWLDFNAEIIKSQGDDTCKEDMAENLALWDNITADAFQTKAGTLRPYYVYSTITADTLAYNGPLIETKWGQSSEYWNLYCPLAPGGTGLHCPVGCGPVAAGQILYYLHQSRNLTVPIPNMAFCHGESATTFSGAMNTSFIDNMPIRKTDTDAIRKKNAGIFLSYLGSLAGAEYTAGSTTTMIDKVVSDVLQGTYHLQGQVSYYNLQYISLSINNDTPLYIRGARLNGDSTPGHAWVLDGLRIIHYTGEDHYCLPDRPLSDAEVALLTPGDCNLHLPVDSYDRRCHMNWGHDGSANGWFDVQPSSWLRYDTPYDINVRFYWNY